jgi:hypothetical protein
MAKADDTTSTDWIFLREALDIAVTAFGSMELARDHLLWEWLAAGKLPWTCIQWEALDDADIAKLHQRIRARGDAVALAAVTYYNGDPRFFGAPPEINWKDSTASIEGKVRTARGLSFDLCVAQARGIKVPRAPLLELLPDESREPEQLRSSGVWITAEVRRMKAAGELSPGIRISELARKLERLMIKAASDKSLRPIKAKSIENGLRRDWGLWPIDSIK